MSGLKSFGYACLVPVVSKTSIQEQLLGVVYSLAKTLFQPALLPLKGPALAALPSSRTRSS